MQNVALRQDVASIGFLVLAVLLSIWLYLFVGLEALITPVILLMGCVIIRVYAIGKVSRDPNPDVIKTVSNRNVMFYTLLALAGMAVGGVAIAGLYSPPMPSAVAALSLSFPLVSSAFSVLMAITETQFFQGELLPFLSNKSITFAVPAVSLLGVAYHWKVYGANGQALLYVFVGFTLLSLAAIKCQRVLPAMLAHILNNLGILLVSPAVFFVLLAAVFVYIFLSKRRSNKVWPT